MNDVCAGLTDLMLSDVTGPVRHPVHDRMVKPSSPFGRDNHERFGETVFQRSEFSTEWVDVVPFALAQSHTIFIATNPAA